MTTRHGVIRTSWRYEDDMVQISLETPVPTMAILPSGTKTLAPGAYIFWEKSE